jgi:tRNA pseudouridine55 synthase
MSPREVTIHSLGIKSSPARGVGPTEPVEGPARTSEQPLHQEQARSAPRSAATCGGRGDLFISPGEDLEEVTLIAIVSKGTYIRSLARDIARALESVGHVTMLRRTKAGPFALESAISLDKLRQLAMARELEQALLPLTAGLDDIPALPVDPDQARLLRQGRTLAGIAAKPGLHLATDASVPVALVELAEGELRVVRGFNL